VDIRRRDLDEWAIDHEVQWNSEGRYVVDPTTAWDESYREDLRMRSGLTWGDLALDLNGSRLYRVQPEREVSRDLSTRRVEKFTYIARKRRGKG
jgi:hypothetical protein